MERKTHSTSCLYKSHGWHGWMIIMRLKLEGFLYQREDYCVKGTSVPKPKQTNKLFLGDVRAKSQTNKPIQFQNNRARMKESSLFFLSPPSSTLSPLRLLVPLVFWVLLLKTNNVRNHNGRLIVVQAISVYQLVAYCSPTAPWPKGQSIYIPSSHFGILLSGLNQTGLAPVHFKTHQSQECSCPKAFWTSMSSYGHMGNLVFCGLD